MLTHVLAAGSLGIDLDSDLIPRNDSGVHECRGVVPRVLPVEEGITHDRAAQVPVDVALRHSSIDRLVQVAASDVDVLTQVQEHDGVSRVLAVGVLALAGDLLVLQ